MASAPLRRHLSLATAQLAWLTCLQPCAAGATRCVAAAEWTCSLRKAVSGNLECQGAPVNVGCSPTKYTRVLIGGAVVAAVQYCDSWG
jgi:hypothetical protein